MIPHLQRRSRPQSSRLDDCETRFFRRAAPFPVCFSAALQPLGHHVLRRSKQASFSLIASIIPPPHLDQYELELIFNFVGGKLSFSYSLCCWPGYLHICECVILALLFSMSLAPEIFAVLFSQSFASSSAGHPLALKIVARTVASDPSRKYNPPSPPSFPHPPTSQFHRLLASPRVQLNFRSQHPPKNRDGS